MKLSGSGFAERTLTDLTLQLLCMPLCLLPSNLVLSVAGGSMLDRVTFHSHQS